MKILHLSDLHIGRRYNEYSLLEDQKFILQQVLEKVKEQKPDLVAIAGDVYDKSVPSEEAVRFFDDFLVDLVNTGVEVAICSGNHDSAERLAFGNRLFVKNLHISSTYKGKLEFFTMQDGFGEIEVYLLPFVKPSHVRQYFPEEKIENFTDALRVALQEVPDTQTRKILLCHQFVTGASKSESEEVTVGTLDNVDAAIFHAFDYVALGHIHRAQNLEGGRIRYCGTLLKYNIAEANQEKSMSFIELKEKNKPILTTHALSPLRDMVVLEGLFTELLQKENLDKQNLEDYIYVVLKDEEEVPNAIGRLRSYFPNILGLRYDNQRTRQEAQSVEGVYIENQSPIDLISTFFQSNNGKALSETQAKLCQKYIDELWGN